MNTLALRIDRVVVELADQSRAGEVEPALRRAMERLAFKLAFAGLVPGAVDLGASLHELGRDALDAETLLSPDGPEQLARALFEAMARRLLARAQDEGAKP